MDNIIKQAMQISTKITWLKAQEDIWWNIFNKQGGESVYYTFVEAQDELKYWQDQYAVCEQKYNELKNKTYSNNKLIYAITIGSAETDNTTPCKALWNRFINSADGKRCYEVQAFFEKGENGYIHIHAIVHRDQKWSMSIRKLQTRYGKYQNKQHNFDIKRLHGLDANKWQNYIRKDSHKEWNKKANEFFLSNSDTPQEL